MSDNDIDTNRRDFLTKAGVAGSAVGLTALAGCTGGEGGGQETTTANDTTESGGGGNQTQGGQGGQAGQKLPQYTYLNNAQSYNPPRHDAINLIARQLNELGLDVNVEVLEWGTLYNRVSVEYNYGFSTWHTFFTVDPVIQMKRMLHSSNVPSGEGNYAGYEDQKADKMMDDYLVESDPKKRVDTVHRLQKKLMDDVPQMPMVQMPAAAIYNSNQVGNWQSGLRLGFNTYYTMVNLKMKNGATELKGYWPETLSTMNVLGHNDESKHVDQFTVMYDTLLRLDGKANIVPDISLAQKWNRVDDTTMEYTIRTDHTWHDGKDLTTEDVAFTFNYIKNNEVPIYSAQSEYIEGATAVDDSTVRINMTKPLGPFNTLVGARIPIIPKHKWQGRSNPSQKNIQKPVGSGPLQFDYWNKGTEFGLKKNPDHFAPVSFDKRFWRIIPEASTVWEMLKNGQLNYDPFGRIDRNLKKNQNHQAIGTKFQPAPSYWHFTPNERQNGLDDKVLRKSMVNTIPRTAIVKQILFGFPEVGDNMVSEAFGKLRTDDVPKYEQSKEKARSRLEQAGYTWDDNGKLHFPSGN